MQNYYNKNQSRYYGKWVSKYYDFEKDAASFEKISRGKSVLEIGLGTGLFASFLVKKGFEVEGIEPSDFMFSILKKRFPNIPCYKGDVVSFDINKKYDMIVSHGTFPLISIRRGLPFFDCFLETDEQNLKAFLKVRKHLKKGGLFLANLQSDQQENIEIPGVYKNKLVFEDRLSKKTLYFWNGKNWEVAQTIVSIVYDRKQFNDIMNKAGFKVIGFSEDKNWFIAEAI